MRKRGSSIHARLKAVTMLQVIICVIAFLFISISKLAEAYRTYEQNTVQAAALYSADVFSMLDNAVEISKFPGLINNTVTPQTYIANALQQGNIQENFDFCSDFYLNCKSIMAQYPSLDKIVIYELDGSAVYVSRSKANYYISQTNLEAPWFITAIKNRGAAAVIPPSALAAEGFGPLFDGSIVITRCVFNPWKLQALGVYAVVIDTAAMENAFLGVRVQNEQQFAIDYDGRPLLAGFENENYADTFAALAPQKSATRIATQDKKLYLDVLYRYNANSTVTIRTPLSAVTSTIFEINLLALIVLAATLVVFIILIRKLFRSIITPLDRLTSAFDRTTGTTFPTVSSAQLPEDLQPVFAAYNRMSERIDILVNEGMRKDMAQRETELQLLRTQINPHYLYNTLECIHMRAYTNRDYDVASMAELLGSNLQYGLRDTTQQVTLRTEIKKAQEYMKLISYHYGDRVHLTTHADAGILHCRMIKLLLQPLIENAIQHGLQPDKQLHIELLAYRADDDIILQVTDDGAGIPSKVLKSLRVELESGETVNAIGLRNVHRRLQLRYGERYKVNISSVVNQSTVVSLNLPYMEAGGTHALSSDAG